MDTDHDLTGRAGPPGETSPPRPLRPRSRAAEGGAVGHARRAARARSPRVGRGDVLLVVAATLVVGAFLVFTALGCRALVITSGSMTPTLRVGDLVVSRAVPPATLRPGDVVTFRSPLFHGDLVTHRVVSRTVTAGQVDVVTKGDANAVPERWSVPVASRVGLGVASVRKVGYWFAAVNTRPGHVAVVLLACAGLAVMGLTRVWTAP